MRTPPSSKPQRVSAFAAATLLWWCAAASAQSASSQQTGPRVHLVATGGTISNRTGERLTAEELVKSMPGIEKYASAEFEQFSNLASSELTLDQWLALARRINQLFANDQQLHGIVEIGRAHV